MSLLYPCFFLSGDLSTTVPQPWVWKRQRIYLPCNQVYQTGASRSRERAFHVSGQGTEDETWNVLDQSMEVNQTQVQKARTTSMLSCRNTATLPIVYQHWYSLPSKLSAWSCPISAVSWLVITNRKAARSREHAPSAERSGPGYSPVYRYVTVAWGKRRRSSVA
jgi:hypothetical protein